MCAGCKPDERILWNGAEQQHTSELGRCSIPLRAVDKPLNQTHNKWALQLQTVNPFDFRSRGDAELIAWLTDVGTKTTAAAGQQLIQEGDNAEALLFLLDGCCVVNTTDANQRQVTLNNLKAGALIGEMSWLEQRPAVANIVTQAPSRVLEVPFAAIEQLERVNPTLAAQLPRLLAQKLALQIQQQNHDLTGATQPSAEPLRKVLTLFANLQQRDVHRLASYGRLEQIRAGEWLLRQGQPVNSLYLVLSGEGEIRVEHEGRSRSVGKARRGELIGEMSLLLEDQKGASADVLAPEGIDLLVIEQDRLRNELAVDPALDCRFHRAMACMLSQRSRDQLQQHQLGQLSQRRERAQDATDDDSLDLQQLEAVSRGARHFDWLCRHFQTQGVERR